MPNLSLKHKWLRNISTAHITTCKESKIQEINKRNMLFKWFRGLVVDYVKCYSLYYSVPKSWWFDECHDEWSSETITFHPTFYSRSNTRLQECRNLCRKAERSQIRVLYTTWATSSFPCTHSYIVYIISCMFRWQIIVMHVLRPHASSRMQMHQFGSANPSFTVWMMSAPAPSLTLLSSKLESMPTFLSSSRQCPTL